MSPFQSPSSRGRSCDRPVWRPSSGRRRSFQSPSSRGRSCDRGYRRARGRSRPVSIPFISGKVLRPPFAMAGKMGLVVSIPFISGKVLRLRPAWLERVDEDSFNPLHLGEGPATIKDMPDPGVDIQVFQSPSSRGRSCDRSRHESSGPGRAPAFQSPSSRGRSCDRDVKAQYETSEPRCFNPLHLGEGPATTRHEHAHRPRLRCFNPLHLGEGPATTAVCGQTVKPPTRFNPLHLGEGPATRMAS